ncbi:MAG: phytanoyl-CoA dioxygenase family protein [Actinomycetota bacterium]
MVSLDYRTRTEGDIRSVDTRAFFEDELPSLIVRHADLVIPGARELGVEPFSFVTPSGAWTLSIEAMQLTLHAGDDGAGSVSLSDEDIADVVNDLKTPMTFLTGGVLRMQRGDLGDFLDWWVVLRALIDGRRVHTRGAVTFEDRDGAALDLGRAFTPDDNDDDIVHFFAQAGFLHLRGWFDVEMMDEISTDMDRALPTYTRDDGRSWWAKTASGDDRCVRMQYFQEYSTRVNELLTSERFLRIGRLLEGDYQSRTVGNRIEALVKPVGVVEGISDVPWHKDCSLGMHSYRCCGLTTGISVTGADARSGQLRVVAGSHRALVQPAFVRRSSDLPIVDLPTSTGDVTVHCSCTLHMAQPPVERERRVMYSGFGLPAKDEVGEGQQRAMAAIGAVREGAYKTVSQAPGFTG